MHVLHHAVKMDAPFLVDREALEEQIHEEGLAATNPAPEVKAADKVPRFAAEQEFVQPSLARAQRNDFRLQVLETRDNLELCRVPDMAFALQAGFVRFAYLQCTLFDVFPVPAGHGKITCLLTLGQ